MKKTNSGYAALCKRRKTKDAKKKGSMNANSGCVKNLAQLAMRLLSINSKFQRLFISAFMMDFTDRLSIKQHATSSRKLNLRLSLGFCLVLSFVTLLSSPSLASEAKSTGKPEATPSSPLVVEKQVFEMPLFKTFGGQHIKDVKVGWEAYGTLNEDKSNVILITHYFSGSSHAAGKYNSDDAATGYWDSIIGPGKAIDTDRFYVVSVDTLANLNAYDPNVITTGPASINPDTGKPYGLDFPVVTIRDFVNVQKALLESLGISKLYAVIGPSMGSMQAIDWATAYPDWRSLGVFSAFIVALFTEMYGFPLTIYFLSGWLAETYPEVNFFAHENGHLLHTFFGFKGDAHWDPFHIASMVFIVAGFFILSSAWNVLHHAQKNHHLAKTGWYARCRHPQYLAFILIMFGFLLQWPTIPTLVMFPVLVVVYVKLAKREEALAIAEFGDEYVSYINTTPGWIPNLNFKLKGESHEKIH
jgi:protein-S-isoprenylcysteine O-methyltransferase Ste14